jgi:tripartite-type tricarboxylate transporter receptor subunit TctC
MEERMRISIGIAAIALAGFAAGAFAQSYPSKVVRLVVPSVPGGGQDVVTRALAQKFSESWGQQAIVENRPGAGGNIAHDVVAKAAPDGYTVLMTTAALAIAPSLYRKLTYDPVKDFVPVSQIMSTYLVLVVHPNLPGNMKELVSLMKANPGKYNYYHFGAGSGLHLTGEMFKAAAGVTYTDAIYKGDGDAIPAMLRGDVHMSFLNPTAAVPQVKAGKLRAVAVSGTARGSAFPEVPTTAELGYPDIQYVGFLGFFLPAGAPRDVVNRIANETIRVVRLPDIEPKMPAWGGESAGTTPEAFNTKFREDIARYAKVIKMANVPLVD